MNQTQKQNPSLRFLAQQKWAALEASVYLRKQYLLVVLLELLHRGVLEYLCCTYPTDIREQVQLFCLLCKLKSKKQNRWYNDVQQFACSLLLLCGTRCFHSADCCAEVTLNIRATIGLEHGDRSDVSDLRGDPPPFEDLPNWISQFRMKRYSISSTTCPQQKQWVHILWLSGTTIELLQTLEGRCTSGWLK